MRAEHQKKPLADVCLFLNGLWKGEKPPFVNVGVIRNTNFTKEGSLDSSDIAYLDVELKKFEKRRLQFGDVILEKSGGGPKQPVGRVALFDLAEGDFSFSNFTSALRVLEPDILDFRFLHKFLHWTYLSGVTEGMQSHSTGIRNLNGDAYKAIEISLPKLLEQKRIVGILDKAFDGIASAKANAEKNLQNARAMFESHLQSVFTHRGDGWVEKRLGDIAKTQYGLSEPMNEDEKGFKIFRMGEVQNGRLIDTGHMKFADIDRMEFKKYKLRLGDVLFNRTNSFELVGKTGIFTLSGDYCFASYLVRVLLDPKVMASEFLNYLMNSQKFQTNVKKKASKSINQANINATILSNEMVQFPVSLEVQRSIVAKLDRLREESERLESIYQRKLAALEALKKSLLYQAFSGQL